MKVVALTRSGRALRVLAGLTLMVVACTGSEPTPAATEDEREAHEPDEKQVLELSSDQLAAFGIQIGVAGPAQIDAGVELLGEVRANGDRLAHIVPRFPGIARDVRKNVGDEVRSGDVLAVIESSDSLAPYELRTLIDGTILDKHLTRGESVDRDKQTFVIADLNTVWVDLGVYQRDFERIAIGQRVRIEEASSDGHPAQGAISYITPALDPVTRTATARVVLDNRDRHWRPGMFVMAQVLEEQSAAVAISRAAVQTLEGKPSVFVQTERGFEPRAVNLGREGASLVEVVSGLSAGERIVTENSFLLKAELGKGSAEHGD